MILEPPIQNTDAAPDRTVLICRNPGRRTLLEGLVRHAETHSSAAEALLAVVRRTPRAVVLNVEDVEGAEHDLLAALRRARPEVPVYLLVKPEDEPLGRGLVREGAADYFVFPGDVYRLPRVLEPVTEPSPVVASAASPAPPAAPGAPAAPGGSAGAREMFFGAACSLANLAMMDSRGLLTDGAILILNSLDAPRGCLFAWDSQAARLDLAATIGEAADPAFDAERPLAERTLRTGETLWAEAVFVPGSTRAQGECLLCLPIAEGAETFGLLCAWMDCHAAPVRDREAVAALARSLGRLYRAALQREHFARLALRDPETGLLKAEVFHTYVDKLLARASGVKAEVAVVVIEPQPDGRVLDAGTLAGLGRAIHAGLTKGRQAGRLGRERFAVALSRTPPTEPGPWSPASGDAPDAYYHDVAKELAALGPRTDPALRLRTAVAVFPRDGARAATLLELADARLAGAG